MVAVPKEKMDDATPNAGWEVFLAPKDAKGPDPPKGVCVELPNAGWAAGWATEPVKLKGVPKFSGPAAGGLRAACWPSGTPASKASWLVTAGYGGGGFEAAPKVLLNAEVQDPKVSGPCVVADGAEEACVELLLPPLKMLKPVLVVVVAAAVTVVLEGAKRLTVAPVEVACLPNWKRGMAAVLALGAAPNSKGWDANVETTVAGVLLLLLLLPGAVAEDGMPGPKLNTGLLMETNVTLAVPGGDTEVAAVASERTGSPRLLEALMAGRPDAAAAA